MTLAQQVSVLLPTLRRFARALSGSQERGDAYVAHTLQTIVRDPSAIPAGGNLRLAVYGLFCRLWQSSDLGGDGGEATPRQAAADRRLGAIEPHRREAFLLANLEGFTVTQTAEILGIDEETAARLIEAAGSDITEQLSTTALIIEDEPIIALDLEDIVRSLGHKIASVARTHGEAIEAIEQEKPGLVLADVQLADGSSGIDAVNDILARCSPPVIFITAFPELLLTGERPEPTFLLAKPYDPAMLKAMISQVLFFGAQARKDMGQAA